MKKPFDKLDYTMRGANGISLDRRLADQIKKHFSTERENRFQLFLLAAGIRKKYMNKATGRYSDEFDAWFKANSLQDLYGSSGNFSKHASAGDVISYTAEKTSNPEKYLQQLPTSLNALYELSLILKDPLEKKKDWFKLCLNHKQYIELQNGKEVPIRDKGDVPLINRKATAPQIKAWYENRKNPPERTKQKRGDDRVLLLATISVSGSLYDFDQKSGDHLGAIKIAELQSFIGEISRLTSRYGKFLKLDSKLSELEEGYRTRAERADPASKLNMNIPKRRPEQRLG